MKTRVWYNRSMDCGPLLGLEEEEDHNLTYNYSSEEELNTSVPVNFVQKSPRSAETSLRRQAFKLDNQVRPEDRKTSDAEKRNSCLSYEDLVEPKELVLNTKLTDTTGAGHSYNDLVQMVHEVKRQSNCLGHMFKYLFNY